jgi:hypothetical protein
MINTNFMYPHPNISNIHRIEYMHQKQKTVPSFMTYYEHVKQNRFLSVNAQQQLL